jgi:hypothetical protein
MHIFPWTGDFSSLMQLGCIKEGDAAGLRRQAAGAESASSGSDRAADVGYAGNLHQRGSARLEAPDMHQESSPRRI